MKRLLIAAVALTLTACGGLLENEPADEFRAASPSRQGVEIKMPAKQALESGDVSQQEQALLGETADWYRVTRVVTLGTNAGTAAVLKLCEEIISYPPTTIDDEHAVWGPWTDSLSPNTWRFTVTKAAVGYDYVLEAKGKTEDDAAYQKIILGHHEPGAAKKQGQGTFTLDWDACGRLPEKCKEVGKADFTYSRNAHLDVEVGIHFEDIKNEQGQLVDADYAYTKVEGGEGSFDFRTTGAQNELLTVKSRWLDSGAGRSDVKVVTSTNVTGTVTECWDTGFVSTYYTENVSTWQGRSWGEAGACVFTDAVYSTL